MQQKLQKSHTLANRPPKWGERFLLKRIDEEDIEISLETRDGLLQALASGMRYVQIGKFTIMVNSIKSIEPKWGEKNIPPRPIKKVKYHPGEKGNLGYMAEEITNQEELDEWDELFGEDK